MPRLIDADAIDFAFPLPDNLEGMLKQIGIEMAKIRVSLAPTIEAEPVRHGRWELVTTKCVAAKYVRVGYCQNCNEERLVDNYCPNCGCKMDGGANE